MDLPKQNLNVEEFTKIADLSAGNRNISIHFKVLEDPKTRFVRSKKWGTMHKLAEILIGDESGVINLVLWNKDIEKVEKGVSYILSNAYISISDESMKLCNSRNGHILPSKNEIEIVNDQENMSLPFAGTNGRKATAQSVARTLDGTPASCFRRYCDHKDF